MSKLLDKLNLIQKKINFPSEKLLNNNSSINNSSDKKLNGSNEIARRSFKIFFISVSCFLILFSIMTISSLKHINYKPMLAFVGQNLKFNLHEANKKALTLYNQKEYKLAGNLLLKVIAQNPNELDLVINLAMVQKKIGQTKKAYKNLLLVLKKDPNNITAINNIGVLDIESSNYKIALHRFNRALAIHPKNPNLLFNIGSLHEELQDTKKSIYYYNRFLKFSKDIEINKKIKDRLNKIKFGNYEAKG